jgi:hypothetical protein
VKKPIKRLFRRIVNLFRPIKFKTYTNEEEMVAEFTRYLIQNFMFDDGVGKFTAEECLRAYLKRRMTWDRITKINRENK